MYPDDALTNRDTQPGHRRAILKKVSELQKYGERQFNKIRRTVHDMNEIRILTDRNHKKGIPELKIQQMKLKIQYRLSTAEWIKGKSFKLEDRAYTEKNQKENAKMMKSYVIYGIELRETF